MHDFRVPFPHKVVLAATGKHGSCVRLCVCIFRRRGLRFRFSFSSFFICERSLLSSPRASLQESVKNGNVSIVALCCLSYQGGNVVLVVVGLTFIVQG